MIISRTPGPNGKDAGNDVDDRVAATLRGFGLEPLEGEVACMVVHVGEFLDLAAPDEHLEPAGDSTPEAQRIGDVADHEMPGLITRVDLAKEVLSGAGRGEKRARAARALHRGTDCDELHQVAELSQIRGDAGQSLIPLVLRFLFEAIDRGVTAVDDELGDAADLSARQHLEAARDPADEAE